MATIQLRIEGLTAGDRARAAETALQMVPGVLSARADAAGGTATVEAAATIAPGQLLDALAQAGFRAEVAG